ncbi:hypothetical protein EVAR_83429_1 [Eumeta japonica]|uniref:Uncharacterized protein n=1 Tax=Eumeta variegata TaxID=151549 RepID=A0A4C1TZT3_EUMVA|nr:hypothetical protein EVAR_83429_1 [Eumeta japonica]
MIVAGWVDNERYRHTRGEIGMLRREVRNDKRDGMERTVMMSGLDVLCVGPVCYLVLVCSPANFHGSKGFAHGWNKLRGGQK